MWWPDNSALISCTFLYFPQLLSKVFKRGKTLTKAFKPAIVSTLLVFPVEMLPVQDTRVENWENSLKHLVLLLSLSEHIIDLTHQKADAWLVYNEVPLMNASKPLQLFLFWPVLYGWLPQVIVNYLRGKKRFLIS